MSRLYVFLVFFCAATREHYLAFNKAWWSCCNSVYFGRLVHFLDATELN